MADMSVNDCTRRTIDSSLHSDSKEFYPIALEDEWLMKVDLMIAVDKKKEINVTNKYWRS